MSWEQRNNDFCIAQTNAQMAFIEAEREVVRLEDENAKLRELVRDMWHDRFFLGDAFEYYDRMEELGVEV